MLSLGEIWIYPVKSLAGIPVKASVVEDRGLRHDRRFVVVDPSGGFLTQRQHASMALVRTAIDAGELVLEARGAPSLRVPLEVEGDRREVLVWDDRCAAIDAGDAAAGWLTRAIGTPARLVRMPRESPRSVSSRYGRPGDVVSFADAFPYLLTTDASLAALNERLARPVDSRRFRPNLVVHGASEPFAEDGWKALRVGPLVVRPCKPCSRCVTVDVDPDTGERGKDVLAALATFRKRRSQVYFGQNLVHDFEGEVLLEVGQAARVE